jgi:hypothetical protein
MTRFAFLVCMPLSPLSLLPMLLLPRLPTVLTKFSFHVSRIMLLWFCVRVMLRFLSRTPVFLAIPPPPPLLLFALDLPCRLAAVADTLLGMVNSDLLLLLLLLVLRGLAMELRHMINIRKDGGLEAECHTRCNGQIDLHRYCRTWEGISHALQAGEQATGICI